MRYDGLTEDRYIVLPDQTNSREIELSCAIRPGALKDRYSVQWIQTDPPPIIDINQFTILILRSIDSVSSAVYQCRVTIAHSIRVTREYPGPRINIQTRGENVKHVRAW